MGVMRHICLYYTCKWNTKNPIGHEYFVDRSHNLSDSLGYYETEVCFMSDTSLHKTRVTLL